MTRAERLEKWTALVAESANLVRDYCVAFAGDACAAPAQFAIRLASVRGQVNALSVRSCPVGSAWDAAADFLAVVRMFADQASPPALRLQLIDRVTVTAERLRHALTEGDRALADIDG